MFNNTGILDTHRNNKQFVCRKYKLPIERRARGTLEPASTATTTANRTNVKIRKLCGPDMLSDSQTAPQLEFAKFTRFETL